MDWAKEKALDISTEYNDSLAVPLDVCAKALRDVQRETAEESCRTLCELCRIGVHLSIDQRGRSVHRASDIDYVNCKAEPIRERFGLKEKHER